MNRYYDTEEIFVESGDTAETRVYRKKVNTKLLLGQRATFEVVDADGEVLVKANRKFTKAAIRKIEEKKLEFIEIPEEEDEEDTTNEEELAASLSSGKFNTKDRNQHIHLLQD